jgi:hypothetical protein
MKLVAVDLESDACRQRLTQLPLRPLHFNDARLGVNLDPLRDSDGFLAYA